VVQQVINHGTALGDRTGESAFSAFTKVNANFVENYAAIAAINLRVGAVYTPYDFNARGDGLTDDTASLQTAIDTAAASPTGGVVRLPANSKFRIASNAIFLHGNVNVVGDSNDSSVLYVDTAAGALPNSNAIVFACGATAFGQPIASWSGQFYNLKFQTSSNASFQRCIWLLAAKKAGVRNCKFDFTVNGWIGTSSALGGTITSGPNANWATGASPSTDFQDFFFEDNFLDLNHNSSNSEGIGFGNVKGLYVQRNKVVGAGDDPIGIHICNKVWIEDNDCSSIDGRIYVENSQEVWIQRNRVTRIVDPVTGLWHAGSFIHATMTNSATNQNQASKNIYIKDNIAIIPADLDSGSNPCPTTAVIRANGVQDGLVIKDNIIQMDSDYAVAQDAIQIANLFVSGWTGPAGNSDFAASGKIRQRNVLIEGNRVTGIGAGTLGISQVNASSTVTGDFIGPMKVANNVADLYTWYSGDNVDFEFSNRARGGLAATFLSVAVPTFYKNKSFNFQFKGMTAGFVSAVPFGPLYSHGVDIVPVKFTGSPASGATNATLNAAWTYPTGAYTVTFSNNITAPPSDVESVTLTNGATTATWSGGLTATCASADAAASVSGLGIGGPFIAERAGRVIGVGIKSSASPGTNNRFRVGVYLNGTVISTLNFNAQSSANVQSYLFDNYNIASSFAAGDKIDLRLIFTVGSGAVPSPNMSGVLEMYYQYV